MQELEEESDLRGRREDQDCSSENHPLRNTWKKRSQAKEMRQNSREGEEKPSR
jgi:hypothetical protein